MNRWMASQPLVVILGTWLSRTMSKALGLCEFKKAVKPETAGEKGNDHLMEAQCVPERAMLRVAALRAAG